MANYGIFEADTLLASQLLPPRSALPEPERSLMVAVFEDAVRCFLNHCGATDRTDFVPNPANVSESFSVPLSSWSHVASSGLLPASCIFRLTTRPN